MNEQLKVRGVTWHGRDVFEIRLEREDVKFVPGDCLALFAADGRVSRPYSIASGNNEDDIRFVIRRMKDGAVSPYLAERKPGDVVRVSPPFGWFRPGEKGGKAPFVFMATGTGIAPFISYFKSVPDAKPVACLYGVREFADAVEVEWLKKQCDLQLAVSREAVAGLHHGRITDLLERVPIDAATDYYLCGLDAMIDDVTRWLEERGVGITRIHRECFFNASYTT